MCSRGSFSEKETHIINNLRNKLLSGYSVGGWGPEAAEQRTQNDLENEAQMGIKTHSKRNTSGIVSEFGDNDARGITASGKTCRTASGNLRQAPRSELSSNQNR